MITSGIGTKAPDPGIYEGISNDEYHSWDACNASRLKLLDTFSPRRMKWELEHRKEPTPALRLGTAFHDYCESPDLFDQRWAKGPKVDLRKKADMQDWQEFVDSEKPRIVLKPNDYDMVVAMGEQASAHPIVGMLQKTPSQIEVSFVAVDPDTELLCKGRVDRLVSHQEDGIRVASSYDYKTIAGTERTNANPKSFRWEIRNRSYLLSMSHYAAILAILNITVNVIRLIAIDKVPPYDVAVCQIDERDLAWAHGERRKLLERYADICRCREFEGYGSEILPIRVPRPATVDPGGWYEDE